MSRERNTQRLHRAGQVALDASVVGGILAARPVGVVVAMIGLLQSSDTPLHHLANVILALTALWSLAAVACAHLRTHDEVGNRAAR